MKSGYFSQINVPSKLLMSLFVIVISFFIFFLIGFFAGMFIFKIDFAKATTLFADITNPTNIHVLKFFQVVQSIGLFMFPPFVIAFLFGKNILGFLQINMKFKVQIIVASILVMLAAVPLINFMGELNAMMKLPGFLHGVETWMKESEATAQKITQAFLNVHSTAGLFLNIFVVAVVPALSEELLFRGVFQKLFSDWTKSIHWGILISAIFFSAFHLQFYGFIPRMLLGLFFGYLLSWSGTIWVPIIAHFINNAFAVIISYFVNIKTIGQEVETIGASANSFIFVIISILTVTGFIYIIYLNRIHKSDITMHSK